MPLSGQPTPGAAKHSSMGKHSGALPVPEPKCERESAELKGDVSRAAKINMPPEVEVRWPEAIQRREVDGGRGVDVRANATKIQSKSFLSAASLGPLGDPEIL